MDKYGYIGIETLLNYCENSKDHAVTPNEFMRMNRVRMPDSHWIPCKERLPEENRTVIASTEYYVYPEARYTKKYGWEWAYESGADYWVELDEDEVKAWQPLPELYQECEE